MAAKIEWMTTEEAAEYLGLSKSTLDNWRQQKKGPVYVRLNASAKIVRGAKNIKYRKADLDDWVERRAVVHNS